MLVKNQSNALLKATIHARQKGTVLQSQPVLQKCAPDSMRVHHSWKEEEISKTIFSFVKSTKQSKIINAWIYHGNNNSPICRFCCECSQQRAYAMIWLCHWRGSIERKVDVIIKIRMVIRINFRSYLQPSHKMHSHVTERIVTDLKFMRNNSWNKM